MKIAIVDERADALGLAVELARAGHDVLHTSADPAYARAGLGLVSKAPNIMSLLPESIGVELYVILAAGYSVQAKLLRARGARVLGGSAWVERLSRDAAFAAAAVESYGLRAPEQRAYPDAESALMALRADPRKYTVRSASTRPFSSDSPEMLEAHVRRLDDAPVLVAPYIPGVELYVETWFHDGRNVFTLAVLENGHMLDGDLGADVGAQTCVAWAYPMREPRAYQSVTKKLEVMLAAERYTGPVGARLLISERDRKPYLLGFCANSSRHVHALRAALGFDLVAFEDRGEQPFTPDFAYSAAVSVPPYPASLDVPSLARAAWGLPILRAAGLYPHDVEAGQEGGLVAAGTNGLVGDVVGVGPSVEAARHAAVRALDEVLVEGKQARRGGGAMRLAREVSRLAAFGYETPRPRPQEVA